METYGRDEELLWLRTHVLEGRAALVTGPPGSGRSHLLRALGERLRASGPPTYDVRGCDAAAGVPLAPFAPVVAALGAASGSPLDDTLDLLARLPALLTAAGAALVVDDVHLLDPASQVLVAQLARSTAGVVASAPDLDALPRALADDALGSDGRRWDVLVLEPLGDDAVLALAATLAGDELAAPSASFVVTRAGGSPRVATELVRGCPVEPGPRGAELGPLTVSPLLAASVDARLDVLDGPAREALEQLATATVLPRAALPTTAVEELAEHGLAELDGGEVRAADALAVEVLLAGRTVAARRRAAARVSAVLDGLEGLEDSPGPLHRRALMRLRAGDPLPPDVRVDAAREATAAGLAGEVLELLDGLGQEDPEVALLRGTALSELERLPEAEKTLLRAADAPDPAVRVRAGQQLGLLHAVRRQDPVTAVEQVAAVADRVGGTARYPLDVDLVKWRLMAGQEPAVPPEVPDPTDAVHRVNTAVMMAMIDSLDGPPAQARAHVEDGLAALAETDAVPAFTGDLLHLSAYLADTFDGRLAEAERAAQRRRRAALRSADPGLGLWEYAAAELALHAGRFRRARVLTGRAVRHLAWRDFTGLRPTATALLAATHARLGRQARAEALLAELGDLAPDAGADVKVALHVARVHAERRLLGGDPTAAAEVLAVAAERACAESHRHLGLLAADEVVMLSPGSDAALRATGHLVEHETLTPVLAVLARRARALHERDAETLVECAERLADLGLPGRAAHALDAAHDVLGSVGRRDGAARAQRRAAVLLTASRSESWPRGTAPPLLSDRELEIARLAATRLRSREIAERCSLSPRTVDNHLARIYRKLGIGGRAELAEALADLS